MDSLKPYELTEDFISRDLNKREGDYITKLIKHINLLTEKVNELEKTSKACCETTTI
jgi:hypothetical protein